jgi:acetylcholinesterase
MDRWTRITDLLFRICPQGNPAWGQVAAQLLTATLLGVPLNVTEPYIPPVVNSSTPARRGPLESEDCLFLDVFVPEDILEKAGRGYGAPVLVWIYGGGYTGGNKSVNFTSAEATLLTRIAQV